LSNCFHSFSFPWTGFIITAQSAEIKENSGGRGQRTEYRRQKAGSASGEINCCGLAVLGIMAGYENCLKTDKSCDVRIGENSRRVGTSAEYGQKIHELTERICKEKIESLKK
jgi:hypothetical protein